MVVVADAVFSEIFTKSSKVVHMYTCAGTPSRCTISLSRTVVPAGSTGSRVALAAVHTGSASRSALVVAVVDIVMAAVCGAVCCNWLLRCSTC